jgi:hypothetical protein
MSMLPCFFSAAQEGNPESTPTIPADPGTALDNAPSPYYKTTEQIPR